MANYQAAIRHLKKADPVMRRLITQVGPCRVHLEMETDEFGTLVDAIIYQQLAYKAAKTISNRFRALYGPKKSNNPGRLPRPSEILKTSKRALRSVGLSRQKIKYMRDLAKKATDGTLLLGRFGSMSDAEVIENVTLVKGIGRWTGEMFLIFCLGRRDVLPVDDLGVQYGFKSAYGLRKLPSEARMEKLAEPWRPHRTIATWYLWKARRKEIGADR